MDSAGIPSLRLLTLLSPVPAIRYINQGRGDMEIDGEIDGDCDLVPVEDEVAEGEAVGTRVRRRTCDRVVERRRKVD